MTKICRTCGEEKKEFIIADEGRMQLGLWKTEDNTFECVTCAFKQAAGKRHRRKSE